MFVAPRFVVVDDKRDHLTAILEAFQALGSPCIGIHYDAARALDRSVFRGVRALFLDLHLIEGAATTDNKRHFTNIASILEDNISDVGGPFVLVIWTEHSHVAAELKTYLDDNLDPSRPYCRPIAVIALPKEQFISVKNGTVRDAEALQKAITAALDENPQLAALIGWEMDVLAAAGETLSSLVGLVPPEERTTERFPPALDGVLSTLAREAVGRAHVATDPRVAIKSALAPILADRIVNQDVSKSQKAVWDKAVTRHKDKALGEPTAENAGALNRMLHVAVPASENITPTDWGAIVDVPAELWNDAALEAAFGLNRDVLLHEEFKIKRPDHDRCRARLVRVGAACDHAQGRRGPIPFLFGVEIPLDVERIKINDVLAVPASEWESPRLLLDPAQGPFRLHVNTRFEITRAAAAVAAWMPQYRLREQLLMQLIAHASGYVSRPGIVRL